MPTKPRGGDAQKSHLTIRQKIAIIQKKFEEPKWTQRRLGEWAMAEFRLAKPPTQATVSNILKTREQLLKTSISHEFCRVRAVKYPELDAAVHTWALSLERNGIRYSGEDIKEKALVLVKQMGLPTDLSFSNGWVSSFMERHQLKFRKSQGRGPDQMLPHVDRTGSASSSPSSHEPSVAASSASQTAAAIATHVRLPSYDELLPLYAPCDIFSMDEVGLFYCLEPKKTKVRRTSASLASSKNAKVRLTLTLAVNMDASEKLEQAFVGTGPWGFEPHPPSSQVAEEAEGSEPQYYYNSSAWMTGPIFQDWVLQINHNMLQQNRRILVLVDDAPSHLEMDLSNVRTLVLPSRRAQPFGVGITRAFKTLFRIRQLAHAVDRMELGESNVFEAGQAQAMRWAKQAWLEVSVDTIRRCWEHTGLSRGMDATAPLSVSSSAVKLEAYMESAICGSLAHLNLLYQVSIESILTPAGEDDVHYIYSDTTIHDLVMRKRGQTYDDENDARYREQHHPKPESSRPAAPETKRRVSDTQKVTLFRDVIALLDNETDIDEELVHVMQFLRRKQAAVRDRIKKQEQSELSAARSSMVAPPIISSSAASAETMTSSTTKVENQAVI